MRRLVDLERLRDFMRDFGRLAREPARIYFTGGASALLLEWRASTIDIDLKIEPETDEILRELPKLKEGRDLNIELASPGDFIPELPGWRERSLFIQREGPLDFFHYDFLSQALSKIERGHARDLLDVEEMHRRRLITSQSIDTFFSKIEPDLYRYPAISPQKFRESVEVAVERMRERV